MTTPPPEAPGRREAAITAALTGAVVVVLGYASGLGLQVNAPSAAQPPVQPATPAVIEPVPPPPAMTMPMEPAMPPMAPMAPMPAMPAMPVMPEMPEMSDSATEPPATEPAEPAEPAPAAEQPKCPPALLEQLPVVGPATVPVTSLLSSVLGSLPVLGGLVAPTSDGTPGTLGCLLGTVVGPQCCTTAGTVPTRVGR